METRRAGVQPVPVELMVGRQSSRTVDFIRRSIRALLGQNGVRWSPQSDTIAKVLPQNFPNSSQHTMQKLYTQFEDMPWK